jgi:hypothetical protein
VVEEFIVPFVLKHVEPDIRGESYQIRSFLEFAGEEAKFIHLFRRFKEEFDAGFGAPCQMIDPSAAIGDAVLAHDDLAVGLAILQIEWKTQRHYVDSVANNEQLDPQFRSLLRHHWMEEAQHAKLDVLLVEALAARRTPAQIARAVHEYLEIAGFFDAGLRQQVDFDLATLEHVTGRSFTAAERRLFATVQTRALRLTYLGSGMTHPRFLEAVGHLGPGLRHRIEEVAPAFC